MTVQFFVTLLMSPVSITLYNIENDEEIGYFRSNEEGWNTPDLNRLQIIYIGVADQELDIWVKSL